MKKNIIHLIGIDSASISPEKLHVLQSCVSIFGADRLQIMIKPVLSAFPNFAIRPLAPLRKALPQIEEALTVSDVAVLASGDPLFFGIGKTLCQKFGQENIRIYPAVSSMQMAFSRFRISWDDARFISVHGRSAEDVVQRVGDAPKVCILTDAKNSPSCIAARLLKDLGAINAARYRVHVAENIGQENERLTTAGLSDIAEGTFSALNVMILVQDEDAASDFQPRFGLQEQEIIHSRGMLTKNEVRAATLHALRLPDTGVFWDVGAGSGSVSIEAARMFPLLKIFTVEAVDEQRDNILANKSRANICNIQVIHGRAPEALASLPDPDRIFVGGSGGALETILEDCVRRLQAGGIIVVNGVIEKTSRRAPQILHALGLRVTMATVSVRRSSYPENHAIDLNPITIITGCKPPQTHCGA